MAKRIVIADDDRSIAEAVALILNEFGYEASSIIDAHKIYDINKNVPDLLLLDVWMSGYDGRDICKKLKKMKETKKLPIIMFSASREIKNTTLDAGANDFIEKPFEMDELIEKIEKYTN